MRDGAFPGEDSSRGGLTAARRRDVDWQMSDLLREALVDLTGAVDAVCDSDAFGPDSTLEPHARSVLELSLQRARAALIAHEAGRSLL